ncbi:MAG: D-2-hydroxyacid dehydrogenase [Chloroflexota bacterium]|nr:D-2-hydroxyacid dehydrogenase [Chloroflexota bacterium]MDE2885437.1 D-2-hydroxyacid dehydrogenase [Chloroflexota bacterium]
MTGSVWAQLPLSEDDYALFAREFPGLTFHSGQEIAPSEQEGTEILLTSQPFEDELVQAMPSLRWVQVTRGGGAGFITPTMRERSIRVTTCTGIHGPPFSEFTFASILTFAKQLPQIAEAQREHRWAPEMGLAKLEGSTLGVVGLGMIGSAVAEKAKAFGMRVIATRMHPERKPEYVDWIAGPDGTPDLMAASDYVVVARPPGRGGGPWITAKELGLMRRNAVLVVLVGGDHVVDLDALGDALRGGSIAGAAINFSPFEPLPEDSPAWDFPNMILSPGLAASDPDKWTLQRGVFIENLHRYLDGGELRNEVGVNTAY